MVIDTSALIAILFDEPESARLTRAIDAAPVRIICAPTLVEAAAVMMARKGDTGEIALDALLRRLEIEVVPLSIDAAAFARVGFKRFGKGVGEPGVLNYGDCFSYGTAMAYEESLLSKGDDFPKTDVEIASY